MVAQVLRKRLNLRFEESLLRQIMKEFDDTVTIAIQVQLIPLNLI